MYSVRSLRSAPVIVTQSYATITVIENRLSKLVIKIQIRILECLVLALSLYLLQFLRSLQA